MSPTKSPTKAKPRSASPTKRPSQSPYTPAQIKHVIQEALSSPVPSLSSPSIRASTPNNPEHGYKFETATTNGNTTQPRTPSRLNEFVPPNEDSPLESSPYDEDVEYGVYNTAHFPVRRLPCSLPRHTSDPQQTFEVQASFMEAIVMLLERQANIAPDSTVTKADLKKMVRSQLRKEEKARAEEAQAAHHHVSTSVIVAATAAAAGLSVYQRARILHPEEMAWYGDGAWKRGLCGLAVVMAVKGVLWAVERGR